MARLNEIGSFDFLAGTFFWGVIFFISLGSLESLLLLIWILFVDEKFDWLFWDTLFPETFPLERYTFVLAIGDRLMEVLDLRRY